MNTPSFRGDQIKKQFNHFSSAKTPDDDAKMFRINFVRGIVTIDTYGVKVVFTKSNRGQYFTDSREPKKRFTRDEIFYEIKRMLNDDAKANEAMKHFP
jgi:hypothetical protein